MIHPYIKEIKNFKEFKEQVKILDSFTIRNLYEHKNRDDLFVKFLREHINEMINLCAISYIPKHPIDISFIADAKPKIVDISIPINKLIDCFFILKMESLIYFGNYTGFYLRSTGTLSKLKYKLKYIQNNRSFFYDRNNNI